MNKVLIRGNNKEGIYMYKGSLDFTSCLVSCEGEDNRKNFFFSWWPLYKLVTRF